MRPRILGVFALALTAAGCSYFVGEPIKGVSNTGVVAVLPVTRATPEGQEGTRLAAGAEKVLTAQVYGVLSTSEGWRVVPDLAVEQALAKVPSGESLAARAAALGKAVKAEAVLYGTVTRYVERDGGEYGARSPASVAFRLSLLATDLGETVWTGDFDQTQEPLSSNLLNIGQYWTGGLRWLSARELTRIGVEQVLKQLERRLDQ